MTNKTTSAIDPTQWGDEVAEEMRAYYEANRRQKWVEGTADNLMLGLLNIALRAKAERTTSAIDLVERLDAPTLARKLCEAHAKFHGFSGERWNDEPWQSRHSWLNIAKTAIEAIQPLPSSDKERE